MIRFLVQYPTPNDVEAFERHYNEVHLPLAKKLPGLRSYSVGRNVSAVRGEAFYLVAELEWDDLDSLQHDFASPLGRECAEDADRLAELCPDIRSVVYQPEPV
jgi:uncharacterized protein (TIGR02118 family)